MRLAELKITTEKKARDEQQANAEFAAQAEQVRQTNLTLQTLRPRGIQFDHPTLPPCPTTRLDPCGTVGG